VAITQCGTFALIGSANGAIDMFNFQSGIHRQRYPAKLTSAQARKLQMRLANDITIPSHLEDNSREFSLGRNKHTKAVTGIMIDGINRTVISCGLDGKVKVHSI
jgi:U3 small nucleolar RNA-associated protein 21